MQVFGRCSGKLLLKIGIFFYCSYCTSLACKTSPQSGHFVKGCAMSFWNMYHATQVISSHFVDLCVFIWVLLSFYTTVQWLQEEVNLPINKARE